MLSALAAGLIRCIYIDGLYQFVKDIRGKLLDANIMACFLNKLLDVLNLCFLYFDFPLQTDDLSFRFFLFRFISAGHFHKAFIRELAEEAKKKFPNADWRVYPIRNYLFGETVTVAGLVCGGDIAKQLEGKEIPNGRILYPKVMLRRDEDMFLDSSTPEQLEEKLGATAQAVANDGFELLDAMLGRS